MNQQHARTEYAPVARHNDEMMYGYNDESFV